MAEAERHAAPAGDGSFSMRVERVAAPVWEEVLDILRRSIIEMRLKPGQRLIERELVEQTGVSRTSIREALRQLEAEGLVTTIPHRGTVVSVPTLEEAEELYEIRAALEALAGREFMRRASDDHVRALRQAFEELERATAERTGGRDTLQAKARFYAVLFAGAGNETVRSIVASLQARVTMLRATSLGRPDRPERSLEEIRAIVEAVEARDAEAVALACEHHVRQAARTALEALASGSATPFEDKAAHEQAASSESSIAREE